MLRLLAVTVDIDKGAIIGEKRLSLCGFDLAFA